MDIGCALALIVAMICFLLWGRVWARRGTAPLIGDIPLGLFFVALALFFQFDHTFAPHAWP